MQPKGTALRPIWPNCGIRGAYRKKITALIDEMGRSYAYWLKACYRANEPAMAQDKSATELDIVMRRLARYWRNRFAKHAPDLAAYFAKSVSQRSDRELRGILRKAGYSVKFKMTAKMRDVLGAVVNENVGLIKSIPQEFHTDVQGIVMRSVARGRDVGEMTQELQKRYGLTRKRAALISLDQNNKATSAILAARQVDLGIEEGEWLHSHAGKEPRPTHLANNGKRFSIKDGWFDPDPKVRRKIHPGELIRCRCSWRPIVKGFS